MATLIGAMSLTSCTKDVYNPEMDPVNRPAENPWEDIAVPAGFNWSTIASVNLKVDVEDAYGGKYGYLIEAFPANPEEDPAAIPLAAGYANLTQSYTTTLRMSETSTCAKRLQTAARLSRPSPYSRSWITHSQRQAPKQPPRASRALLSSPSK